MPGEVAAVLDVGSNSVLSLVGRLDEHGALDVLDDALTTTRLGAGLVDGGRLDAAAAARTAAAVQSLAARARARGATAVFAFATGAARRAVDGRAFVATLAHVAGVTDAAVIDGTTEAMLAYRAAAPDDAPACAVVDIGGGTTEITFGRGATIVASVSLPLGALALTERHGRATTASSARAVRAEVASVLAGCDVLAAIRAESAPLAASGGTATALAALDLGLTAYDPARVHGHRLTMAAIDGALDRLACEAPPPGLDAGRAEILPAGALVLQAVLRAVGAETVQVSDRGVRHAYLLDRLRAAAGASA